MPVRSRPKEAGPSVTGYSNLAGPGKSRAPLVKGVSWQEFSNDSRSSRGVRRVGARSNKYAGPRPIHAAEPRPSDSSAGCAPAGRGRECDRTGARPGGSVPAGRCATLAQPSARHPRPRPQGSRPPPPPPLGRGRQRPAEALGDALTATDRRPRRYGHSMVVPVGLVAATMRESHVRRFLVWWGTGTCRHTAETCRSGAHVVGEHKPGVPMRAATMPGHGRTARRIVGGGGAVAVVRA